MINDQNRTKTNIKFKLFITPSSNGKRTNLSSSDTHKFRNQHFCTRDGDDTKMTKCKMTKENSINKRTSSIYKWNLWHISINSYVQKKPFPMKKKIQFIFPFFHIRFSYTYHITMAYQEHNRKKVIYIFIIQQAKREKKSSFLSHNTNG